MATKPERDKGTAVATTDEAEATAKRVFELFVETLEGERDIADEKLLARLRWFGEDVGAAIVRLEQDPRAARPLIHSLGSDLAEIARHTEAVGVMEENVHQARRWALLLPEVSVHT